MNSTIIFTIIGFLGSLFLMLNLKDITDKNEIAKKIYKSMIITNFIAILIEGICCITLYLCGTKFIGTIIATRLFLVLLATWVTLLTFYTCAISYDDEKRVKNLLKYISIIYVVFLGLVIFLPLKLNGELGYAYGPATKAIFYVSEVYIILSLIFMFRANGRINFKKYSPLFIYIAGGIVLMLLQSMHPEWLLANFVDICVNMLMFFTIYNPKLNKK